MFSCFSSNFPLTFLTFYFIFSYLSFSFKIVMNSSWLIYMSISAWDIRVLMLLSLLLADIRILSCFFFLFFVVLNNLFIIPVAKENTIVNLTLAIPTGAWTAVAWETIHKLLLLLQKGQLKFYLCNQKQ